MILKRFVSNYLCDKLYLSLLFHSKMGYWMDWKNPKTFNEKLQWLKLYNRKPEYTIMADKIKAKEWVAERIGAEYIIPTLGVWDDPNDIDFEKLPNQFVLKCNHNSGLGMYICKDKSKMDIDAVKQELREGLKENYYLYGREWPYKDVPRKILAEQFMVNELYDVGSTYRDNTELADYKFFCFNGEPYYCQVIRNRSTEETIDFYDMEWNHQPFVGLNPGIKNGLVPVPCPAHLDKMKEICRCLAKDIPFVRVDLYIINEKEYFGELTFFPMQGVGSFTPDDWNDKIGDLLRLPNEVLPHMG